MLEIVNKSYQDQLNWLVDAGKSLQRWNDAEDHSIMAQAEILYTVWSVWEAANNPQGLSLKDEAKSPWGYDFYKWAKAYSKRRALKEPADETITNKITVYRDFIAEQTIEYPEVVYLPKRDEYGRIINPELIEESDWEVVEFNPKDCDYGKLLVCRGAARRGEMSPEAWSALRDPHATVSELKLAIKGDKEKDKGDSQDDFSIYEQDGIIYGCCNGHRVAVLQALLENSGDEVFNRTICHILKAAGLSVPLHYRG